MEVASPQVSAEPLGAQGAMRARKGERGPNREPLDFPVDLCMMGHRLIGDAQLFSFSNRDNLAE
jgi:hypothetical protein